MPHTNMPRSASSTALAFAAVMLVALNLRPAITSVSPVLSRIGEALQMSPFGLGVLTTLPVLFLGLAAPIAPRAAARIGVDRAVLVAILCWRLACLFAPI